MYDEPIVPIIYRISFLSSVFYSNCETTNRFLELYNKWSSIESYFIFASKISKEMFELHKIFSTLMFSNVLFIRRRQVWLLYSIIALRVHFPSIWSAYAVNAAQCILSSRCPPRQNVSNVNSCDTYKCICISSTWKRQLICNVDRPWRRAGG